jgi:transcriptional regulator with XRE-family HTH domain
MSTVLNFYKKIQEFRQNAGMTQEELAKKVGLSRGAVTSIEQGKRKVTVEELLKFCEAFNCSYGDFLVLEQKGKSSTESGKKNVRELYDTYKEKYQGKTLPYPQNGNPLDDYLRQVNPYYYPSSNNEIRYEQ